jgi:hypothetical protein
MSNPEELRTDFNINYVKQHIELSNKLISSLVSEGKTNPFDYEYEIMTQYPEFYQDYPSLVKKLCKRDDMTMLVKMLDNLDNVMNGKSSLCKC